MSSSIFNRPPAPDDRGELPVRLPLTSIPGFRLQRVIGTGGMGVVYEAWDEQLARPVAVKVLHAVGQSDPLAGDRFRTEARVLARLRHPQLVQPYQFGEVAGSPYLVMELVDGPNLQAAAGGRPVPPATAATLLQAAAEAVGHAHRAGVVHRDLKPGNILLAGPNLAAPVRVTDFGMAYLMNDHPDHIQDGLVVGTPGYMAPEQCLADGVVGPWTDVYALGVVLYELLTGRRPFHPHPPNRYMSVVQEVTPVPPCVLRPEVPADLESICLKCLDKQPQDRYLTADELADDLARFVAGRPVAARPLGGPAVVLRAARRHPVIAALVLTTLGSLVAGTVVSAVMYDRADARRRDAETAAAATERALRSAEDAAAAARRQSDRADHAAYRLAQTADVEFVRDHFTRGLVAAARQDGHVPVLVANLSRSLRDCEQRHADRPGLVAHWRLMTARHLAAAGELPAAEGHYRQLLGVGVRPAVEGAEYMVWVECTAADELAILLGQTGRLGESGQLAERYAGKSEAVFGRQHIGSRNLRLVQCWALVHSDRPTEAAAVGREVLANTPPDCSTRPGLIALLAQSSRMPGSAAAGVAAAWRP